METNLDKRISKVLIILEERWNQRIKIADLASTVNLSSVRLQHLMKKEVGKSIRAFLTERRLDCAAHFLQNSSLTVKEICHRVGFTNMADFYRSFRKRFGCGPQAFRSESRRQN